MTFRPRFPIATFADRKQSASSPTVTTTSRPLSRPSATEVNFVDSKMPRHTLEISEIPRREKDLPIYHGLRTFEGPSQSARDTLPSKLEAGFQSGSVWVREYCSVVYREPVVKPSGDKPYAYGPPSTKDTGVLRDIQSKQNLFGQEILYVLRFPTLLPLHAKALI